MEGTPNKSGWDKRAWKIGIFWGNLFGIMAAAAGYPPIRLKLNAIFPAHNFRLSGGEIIIVILGVSGFLLLPAILSFIAQRNSFLWGLLPLALCYIWIEIREALHRRGGVFWQDTAIGLGAVVALWLLIPGPISLYRYSRVRAERKRVAMQAQFDAQRVVISVGQPAVWPPPPNYTDTNRQ